MSSGWIGGLASISVVDPWFYIEVCFMYVHAKYMVSLSLAPSFPLFSLPFFLSILPHKRVLDFIPVASIPSGRTVGRLRMSSSLPEFKFHTYVISACKCDFGPSSFSDSDWSVLRTGICRKKELHFKWRKRIVSRSLVVLMSFLRQYLKVLTALLN